MKLATWNINSLAVRLPQLLDWLAREAPDVMCLQETKLADDKFPQKEIVAAGYHVEWFGQRTYNGVALLTREPARDVVRNIPGHDDTQARVIAGTVGAPADAVRVIGLYVPNGQSVDSDKFVYKLAWLDTLRAWIEAERRAHPRLVLMGDFNIAPEDRDIHDPVLWANEVMCTSDERAHFKALLDAGFVDAFRLFEQPPKQFTWWDYRMLGFQKGKGLRIDHILVSQALRPRVEACAIDRAMRKNERPSDHAPVWMTLAAAA